MKCRGCGKTIMTKDGCLCTVEPSKAHPKRINVVKSAFKHSVVSWDAKSRSRDDFYLCWDCETRMVEAVKNAKFFDKEEERYL